MKAAAVSVSSERVNETLMFMPKSTKRMNQKGPGSYLRRLAKTMTLPLKGKGLGLSRRRK